jgi:hypothetical protein
VRAFKLIEAAQARWRAVNASPDLVALVRTGARFEKGNKPSSASSGSPSRLVTWFSGAAICILIGACAGPVLAEDTGQVGSLIRGGESQTLTAGAPVARATRARADASRRVPQHRRLVAAADRTCSPTTEPRSRRLVAQRSRDCPERDRVPQPPRDHRHHHPRRQNSSSMCSLPWPSSNGVRSRRLDAAAGGHMVSVAFQQPIGQLEHVRHALVGEAVVHHPMFASGLHEPAPA